MSPVLIDPYVTYEQPQLGAALDVIIVRPLGWAFPERAHRDELAAALAAADRRGIDALVVDLDAIDVIAESGLALLRQVQWQARHQGCRLLICGLGEEDADRLRILDAAFAIFADEASALDDVAAFRREVPGRR